MGNDHSKDFGPFDGKIWLNSAGEGALPRVSVAALQEAVTWKVKPFQLTHQRFQEVPLKLKAALGRLLGVDPLDVILGNSATYGIHLLANGIPFTAGDEVLLMRNDFPTDILPWLALEEQGVKVLQLASRGPVIEPEEILKAITPATRVVCLPHVHTFSGHILDVPAIAKICRRRNIIFVLNVSQSLGYIPLDLNRLAVDAVTSAGFKWLCGPYGTGVCWIKPELRSTLKYRQAFWVNVMSEQELASTGELRYTPQNTAKALDVFGTANFFNFVPLTASAEYFLKIGIGNVGAMIDQRVQELIKGLDGKPYTLISPREKGQRSALVVFSHTNPEKNGAIFRRLIDQGIFPARWKGNLRVAPHIFNTAKDINKLLWTLNEKE